MSITLTSSYGAVTLRNPLLGNSEQYNIFTKYKVSMSKKVHSIKLTPPQSKLLLTFQDLTQTEYNNLLTWLKESAGMTMTYTDYDSVVWTGVLINNPFEIMPSARKEVTASSLCTENFEVASITLEFQALDT